MSGKTLQEQACDLLPEYSEMCHIFTRKFVITSKSQSCISNYLRQISKLIIHYKCNPLDLTIDRLEEYLYWLKLHESPSASSFKHLVYGLRHFYRIFKQEDLMLSLPSIANRKRLPVVLSLSEVHRLLMAPRILKHRVLLGVIYDCGLRISELRNLTIGDVDMDRQMVHIRESKCKKDRYVPISSMAIRGIKRYMALVKPRHYLFNGAELGKPISTQAIREIMRNALRRSGISKKACVHTLRHSYATHLLESGLNIMTVKEQLGHTNFETTLMYLHIAQVAPKIGYSPLSVLYHYHHQPVDGDNWQYRD